MGWNGFKIYKGFVFFLIGFFSEEKVYFVYFYVLYLESKELGDWVFVIIDYGEEFVSIV